jgi:2-amino-4-hydroxy-6-hydroxymethyldihydropteridine diphosphokinase
MKSSLSQNRLRGPHQQHRSGAVTSQLLARGKVLVGLGANRPGPWGTPTGTIGRALQEIERAGAPLCAVSPFYETAALGRARQPPYVNAVALLDTTLPPEALLRLLKRIERQAGRRGGRPWGPRTLDIDIVDYRGLVRHWTARRGGFARAGPRPLVLPHPLMHQRPFVLRPLLDIAPDWRHPVLGLDAKDLWRRAAKRGQGAVIKKLHPSP